MHFKSRFSSLFFDVFFDGFVNESEISRKKVSQIFGFFTFLPYICLVDETIGGFSKVQKTLC